MIGDLRTDALHQALADTPIEDDTLLGLLILAFGGDERLRATAAAICAASDRKAIAARSPKAAC